MQDIKKIPTKKLKKMEKEYADLIYGIDCFSTKDIEIHQRICHELQRRQKH